mgnify:CR=1 FL=1
MASDPAAAVIPLLDEAQALVRGGVGTVALGEASADTAREPLADVISSLVSPLVEPGMHRDTLLRVAGMAGLAFNLRREPARKAMDRIVGVAGAMRDRLGDDGVSALVVDTFEMYLQAARTWQDDPRMIGRVGLGKGGGFLVE